MLQTFKTQQTGNLVGLWIAAACAGCGTGVNDGAFRRTVGAYAAGVNNEGGQVLFGTTGLAAGQHTLKLVKRSGQYMLLDALTFLP